MRLVTLLLVAPAALFAVTAPASSQSPHMLAVQVQEVGVAGELQHRVSVLPRWRRPISWNGPFFGTDVGPADLFVYVGDPDFTPGRDQGEDVRYLGGCTHESISIPWGTDRYANLRREDYFCDQIREPPVSQITELRAMWLGNMMDCYVDREVSRRQPAGIRTFSCVFRSR